jgi:hypothetical protein
MSKVKKEKDIEFTCPKCGSHRFGRHYIGISYREEFSIGYGGDSLVFEEKETSYDAEGVQWECWECDFVIKDDNTGFIGEDEKEVIRWIREHS